MKSMRKVVVVKVFVGLLLHSSSIYAGSHSLWMFATFIKGETPFPEFSAVALLDDIQIAYYDTIDNKPLYRGVDNSDIPPDESDKDFIGMFVEYIYGAMRERAAYLRDHLNNSKSMYVLQRASGCELLDNEQSGGFMSKEAFNGEGGDARYYNPQLNTLHIDQVWPQSEYKIWPVNVHFYENMYHPKCIRLLQKYLIIEKNRVLKKVKPRVRLFRRMLPGSSDTLLTCLATGFYPRHINLTLVRDGQSVSDHQITGGELLPNGDETYQMRKRLEVSAEELQHHQYTCTAEHLSLDNKQRVDLVHEWDSVTTSIVSSALVGMCVCLIGAGVGVFIIYRRKHTGQGSQPSLSSSYTAASSTDEREKIEGTTSLSKPM